MNTLSFKKINKKLKKPSKHFPLRDFICTLNIYNQSFSWDELFQMTVFIREILKS